MPEVQVEPRNRAERRHPERVSLLDYEGVAEMLGCTPRMVRKLCETRQLASVKIGGPKGGLVRIAQADVDDFIASRRREAVR